GARGGPPRHEPVRRRGLRGPAGAGRREALAQRVAQPARAVPEAPAAVRAERRAVERPVPAALGPERTRGARPRRDEHPVAVLRLWRYGVTLTAAHALLSVLYSTLFLPYSSLAAASMPTRAWW